VSYDTGLANRLRAAGLRVVECSGWQSRGSSSFTPRGSVNHHTAGGPSGATPSLNICINGRSDLEGPLCNVMQSREPDGRDIAYVVAAGRANHAGEGGWKGLSGNSSVYGLEIEHTGTSTLPSGRQNIAAAIHAAMFGGDPAYVCQHAEWAPDRKIDAATGVNPDAFRNLVAAGGGAPMDLLEELMALDSAEVEQLAQAIYSKMGKLFNDWLPRTVAAVNGIDNAYFGDQQNEQSALLAINATLKEVLAAVEAIAAPGTPAK
jgi:hypothetical protein